MTRMRVVSLLHPTVGGIHAPPLTTPAKPKRTGIRSALDHVEQAYRTNRGPLPRRVCAGHRVTLVERESMELVTLVVTRPVDSDPARGRISSFSPLGRGLIGAELGDVVDVSLGNLSSRFYVLRIEPEPEKEAL